MSAVRVLAGGLGTRTARPPPALEHLDKSAMFYHAQTASVEQRQVQSAFVFPEHQMLSMPLITVQPGVREVRGQLGLLLQLS